MKICFRRVMFASLAAVLCFASAAHAADAKKETYYYFVFSNPIVGQEDVYNEWYNNRHQYDVVAVPGFMEAQRFIVADTQLRNGAVPKQKYLILYKIVTDDLAGVLAEVGRRVSSGETYVSPSFDTTTSGGGYYRWAGPEALHQSAANTGDTYIHVVFNNAAAGKDDEFVAWYENQHLPDMVKIDGFTRGQFGILNDLRNRRPNKKYMALFEIHTADFTATAASFHKLAPAMKMTPAFDSTSTEGYTYKAMERVISGDDVRAARAAGKPH